MYSRWLGIAVAGVLPAVLAGVPVAGQESGPRPVARERGARIVGTVLIEGLERPLKDARVALQGQGIVALTDSLGRFVLDGVRPGEDVLELSRLDFTGEAVPLVIGSAELYRLDLIVPYPVTQLEELMVRVESSRRRGASAILSRLRVRGNGFTAADIAERRPTLMSDMFRMLGGRIDTRNGEVRLFTRGADSCTPQLYIDGFRQRARPLDSLDPEDILAVEVHHQPYVPARYTLPFYPCGSILVWTRWGFHRAR